MKMSRKTVRIITAVMMFLMILSVASTVLGSSWTPQANEGAAGADSIKNIINAVLGWVHGIGVAVIMLIVLAIKYISAAPGDKAEIKKHAVVYVVGAVILFAATGILQIIRTFATQTITG